MPETKFVKQIIALMKKLLIIVAVFLSFSGFAQKTADIGIWIGASSYWGDMTTVNYGESINPVFGAFFRYNFNKRVALRTSFLSGKVGAVGDIENTPWMFEKAAQDISMMVEINYLNYILGAKNTPFTPYIMAGIGFMGYNYNIDGDTYNDLLTINPNTLVKDIGIEESVFELSIPFGMGIKYTFGKKLGVGVEVQFRKLMNDKLDNLDDPFAYGVSEPATDGGDPVITEYRYADKWHNNDYVPFVGINLTYSINLTNQVCPVYDSKK